MALHSGKDNRIDRLHPHDPSWQNWPLLEHAIIGNIVPDFPLINKSFNLSYTGAGFVAMYQIIKQMLRTGIKTETPPSRTSACASVQQRLQENILKHFGRALAIRHVDAGSCNGCELEIHCLNNPYYNIEGLGITFRRQPAPCRHAAGDRTGVAQHGNRPASAPTTPRLNPNWWSPSATAAARGDIWRELRQLRRDCNVIPVDVAVPGCPPTPDAILQGILTAVSSRQPG